MTSHGNMVSAAVVVLGRLKDFQRRTAEYAFHRLFQAPDSTPTLPDCGRGRAWENTRGGRADRPDGGTPKGDRHPQGGRDLYLFQPSHSAAECEPH